MVLLSAVLDASIFFLVIGKQLERRLETIGRQLKMIEKQGPKSDWKEKGILLENNWKVLAIFGAVFGKL